MSNDNFQRLANKNTNYFNKYEEEKKVPPSDTNPLSYRRHTTQRGTSDLDKKPPILRQ